MGIISASREALVRQAVKNPKRESAGTFWVEGHHWRNVTPRFVGPNQRPSSVWFNLGKRGPADDAVEKLVEVIGRKGWEIPGIKVRLKIQDFGNFASLAVIKSISGGEPGNKWEIVFGREAFYKESSKLPNGVRRVITPQRKIDYADTGVQAYRYLGEDWSGDEDIFMKQWRRRVSGDGKKRVFLVYEPDMAKPNMLRDTTYQGRELMALGVEGGIEGPEFIPEDEIFGKVRRFLEELAAEIDAAYPDCREGSALNMEKRLRLSPLPVPEGTPPLFIVGSHKDWDPVKCCVLRPLCHADTPIDPARPFSEKAYEPYLFAFVSEPFVAGYYKLGFDPMETDCAVFKVTLTSANDIFVVDGADYKAKCDSILKELRRSGIKDLSDTEEAECFAAMARRMVPLTAYKGDFKAPMYLIGRPLEQHEVSEAKKELQSLLEPSRSVAALRRVFPNFKR